MTTADEELAAWLRNGEMAKHNEEPSNPIVQEAARELAARNGQRVNDPRGPGKTALPIVRNGKAVDIRPSRRHKYNAQPTQVDGLRFDSKREAQRYQELQVLVVAGEIHALQLQPRFELQPSFVDKGGKRHRAINYVADFQYFDSATGKLVVEEVKGYDKNRAWRMKYKMFLYLYPKMELRIVK